ncbi:MAG: ATPase [Treponema sp.]|jgi:V/A-type H+-transporting ATPase subunit E|nr:ATPase [Treponema sp.]
MEELQSTELLDREIREDAQKKAYRILKLADEAVQARDVVWEQKTRTSLAEMRQKYAQGFATIQREFQARLVLDKRRIWAEKIEELLESAMNAYFRSLPRETLLSLLTGELQRCIAEVHRTGEPVSGFTVQCRGLTDAEGTQVLKTCLPSGTWTFSAAHPQHIPEEPFPDIVADAPTVQITVSIRELGRTLLEDKRAELVEALMGPDVLVNEVSL